jgi:Asp-tRNA(Asn)/Glu-tRNA(Gln) amidotransferase A subunit family amidase
VGVQIIAPPLAEADLFRAAAALEGILDIAGRLPVDPVSS